MNTDLGGMVANGLRAGALATSAMSAVMLSAKKTGLMGELPPKKITRSALRRLPLSNSRRQRAALSTASHCAYGVACGVLYATLERRLPRRLPRALVGAGFGLLVWIASYVGWVPALGIMRPPRRDRRGRPTSMIVSHLVYGAVLGTEAARGRRRRGELA